MSRALLPLFILLLPLCLFAAGHDISVVRYAPSDSPVGIPSIASNGNHFLTLWPMSSHLYGALASPSSATMPRAFLVLPFANASAVQLTAAGDGYVAVWNQEEAPYLGTLTSEGVLERSVRLDAGKLTEPRMAFNGEETLVIDRTGNLIPPATIVGSLYDLGGRLMTRFMLTGYGGDSYDVTNAGGDFAVVTAGLSGVNEWHVANDGTIVSTLEIEPPPANPNLGPDDVSVTWKSGRIAIAWQQFQTAAPSFAVIQADGSVARMTLPNGGPSARGMALLPVATPPRVFFSEPSVSKQPSPAEFALRPDVAWDGQHFIVVFAEIPNIPCTQSVCPEPTKPDRFRVMRLSATGDAIDTVPVLIPGVHAGAHVASSGTESLIALDGLSGPSTMILHGEGGILQLDPEAPLFHSFNNIGSAVAWNGASYVVGWRYAPFVAALRSTSG